MLLVHGCYLCLKDWTRIDITVCYFTDVAQIINQTVELIYFVCFLTVVAFTFKFVHLR